MKQTKSDNRRAGRRAPAPLRRLRVLAAALIAFGVLLLAAAGALAVTWEFDTPTGLHAGKNPFTPRGYLVDTGKGQQWLSSGFTNDGEVIMYTGVTNGVDWIEAKEGIKLYAMTDRNPTPGKTYLAAWKNGRRISGFGDMAGTPGRGESVDPSGNGTCWVIPLDGFTFESGCQYEFGFLRGMMANNGITLVLSLDGKGYIQAEKDDDGNFVWDPAERAEYENKRWEEYEFIDHWDVNVDGDGNKNFYNFHYVPMRFSVQTYADLSIWNAAAAEAQQFLDSVTEADYANGLYVKSNVDNLQATLQELQGRAEGEVRRQLQPRSNASQMDMADELIEKLNIAKTEKPQPADMSVLLARLAEAQQLYEKVKDNTGKKEGQYSKAEVQALADEIRRAEKLHQYDPQSKINKQAKALQTQILRVKASQVRPKVRTFYDKVTGIMVVAPIDAFPDDASMIVRRIDHDAAVYKAMVKNLAKTENKRVLYDIGFFSKGTRIQPSKEVQIQIPVPNSMKDLKVSLLKVSDKGKLTVLKGSDSNGIVMFKIAKTDLFALTAHEKPEDEDKDKKKDEKPDPKKKQDSGNAPAGSPNGTGTTGGSGGSSGSGNENKSSDKTDGDSQLQNVMMNMQEKIAQQQEKQRELAKAEKNKEEFKPPEALDASHNPGTAMISGSVTREADPKAVVYGAIALAVAAILAGAVLLARSAGVFRRKKR